MGNYAKTFQDGPGAGSVTPKDLTTLAYRTMLLELSAGDNLTELHGYAHRLLANGVPLVLCGADAELFGLRASLTAALGGEGLQTSDVALHIPSHGMQDRYRFRVLRLIVMTTKALTFRVCSCAALSIDCCLSCVHSRRRSRAYRWVSLVLDGGLALHIYA